MGNSTTPFGLRPLRYLSGKDYDGACRPYYIRSDYGTALYIGDPVVITSDGGNAAAVRGHPIGSLQTVNKFTQGTSYKITGVIVGFEPISGSTTPIYHPASTEGIALVADDPDLLFLVKDDGGATLTVSSVGLNANLSTSASGSTFTGLSGVALAAATTPTADATYQLYIQQMDPTPDNTPAATYQNWVVLINQHTLRGAGVITGV